MSLAVPRVFGRRLFLSIREKKQSVRYIKYFVITCFREFARNEADRPFSVPFKRVKFFLAIIGNT